jgi:hypothetical protein
MLADKIIETTSDHVNRLSWLIDYLVFYVKIKDFSIIWTITSEVQPNLGLYSMLRAFAQGDHATPVMTLGLVLSGLICRTAPVNRPLWHTRECGGSILTWILFYSAERCKCKCILFSNSDWIIKTKTVFWPICKLIFNS